MTQTELIIASLVLISLTANVIGFLLIMSMRSELRRQGAKSADAPLPTAPAATAPPQPTVPAILSPADIERLQVAAKAQFDQILKQSSDQFQRDLATTSTKLSDQVSKLTTLVIEREMERYHDVVNEVTEAATKTMSRIQEVVEEQRQSMEIKLQEEVKAEKERLLAKFDTNMADILSSYLTEALGQGVDLGAQSQYILKLLEEHKQDLKKEMLNGL